MVPWRAHSGEPTKQDTLHVWESRRYILTSPWKKSRALRTRRQRVCGWKHCFGPQSASIARLLRQIEDGSPPIRSSMRAARRCRYCRFSSRPTTECPGNARGSPVPASYFLNFGYNHGRDYYKLLDAETGKVVFSRDATWHHPEAPLILPATAAGNPPAAPPEDIYVPMPTPVPSVAVPSPALAPAATLPPPPTPLPTSPAPIPPRISRELEYEGYVEMPERTRGKTPTLRDAYREYTHCHGLPLDHMRLWCQCWRRVKQSTKLSANTALRKTRRTYMPTAHASDPPTPNRVSDVEKSSHAEKWRHSVHQ